MDYNQNIVKCMPFKIKLTIVNVEHSHCEKRAESYSATEL